LSVYIPVASEAISSGWVVGASVEYVALKDAHPPLCPSLVRCQVATGNEIE